MSSANGQSIVEEVPLQPLVAKVANEATLEARIRPISGDDVLSPKPSAASVRPAISCTSLNEDRVNRTSKSRPQFLSKYKNVENGINHCFRKGFGTGVLKGMMNA